MSKNITNIMRYNITYSNQYFLNIGRNNKNVHLVPKQKDKI